ncbi:MAG TPA: hypothetical protein VI160_02890 [Gemmatimonadales bacterium]
MIDFDEREDAELERLARGLGARAGERLDVERTVQGVTARLRAARASERPLWARPRVLQIAAAVVLVVGAAWLLRTRFITPAQPTPVASLRITADLDDLSTEQLSALLPALDSAGDVVAPPDDTGIEGLSADELRQLLAVMKGDG